MITGAKCWSVAAAVTLLSLVPLSAIGQPDGTPRKFSGEYAFYSGSLAERALPTRRDAKVWMEISGVAASRMYGYLGPAAKIDSCSDTDEARSRDKLVCFRSKGTGSVTCHFGFDMRSGKAIGGVIC
jgi:hypothetical protein